jgi:hypothetical protein
LASVTAAGELEGLAQMIHDLIEGNLAADPSRARLLRGPQKRVGITATDLGAEVGLFIGDGAVSVSSAAPASAHLSIRADSGTLLDLPRAKLMGGLPSVSDPIGRAVTAKLLKGEMKIKGMYRLGLLTRVQKLLSVA